MAGALVPSPAGMRAVPGLPVQAFRTFQIFRPLRTHWRQGKCEEVKCEHWAKGWVTIVPVESVQYAYIKGNSGRKFTETIQPGGLAEFRFEAGQDCFAASEHRMPIDRDPILKMRDGDWRGNPTDKSYRLSSDSWGDAIGENLERLKDSRQKYG